MTQYEPEFPKGIILRPVLSGCESEMSPTGPTLGQDGSRQRDHRRGSAEERGRRAATTSQQLAALD